MNNMSTIEIKDKENHYDVDPETGEITNYHITETTRHIRKVSNYNEFIMIYLEDMSSFLRLENITQVKLLSLIWRDVPISKPDTDEGNIITILKEDKEKWGEEIKVTLGTINNAISALVKKNLLFLVSRSRYKLNPAYFFKGKSSDRSRLMKIEFNYQIGDISDEIAQEENIKGLSENNTVINTTVREL